MPTPITPDHPDLRQMADYQLTESLRVLETQIAARRTGFSFGLQMFRSLASN
jgi:hypothetical protein